ncbi:MAG: hypothetical protein KDE27_31070 [Planctomycetes bacterium]|nr:hypothetical protein [Planctomycetota bacterium]
MNSRTLLATLVPAVALAAQDPRGYASSFPVAFVLQSPTLTADTPIYLRSSDRTADIEELATYAPGLAHFSVAALRAGLDALLNPNTPFPNTAHIEIDGMSTGNDGSPVVYHTSGQFEILPEYREQMDSWVGLFFSYEPGTDNPTDWLGSRAANSESTGAEIIGHYPMQGAASDMLISEQFLLEQTIDEFNFTTGIPLPAVPNIVAMDFAMARFAEGAGTNDPGINLDEDIWFTLTDRSAASLGVAAVLGPNNVVQHITGATVFHGHLNGNSWDITVAEDWSTLGLNSEYDVDMVMVGPTSIAAELVAGDPDYEAIGSDELTLFYSLATNAGPTLTGEVFGVVLGEDSVGRKQGPVRGPNSATITSNAGTPEVTAGCGKDPEILIPGLVPPGVTEGFAVRIPGIDSKLGFSACHHVNQSVLHMSLSGWQNSNATQELVIVGFAYSPNPYTSLVLKDPAMSGWDPHVVGTRLKSQADFPFKMMLPSGMQPFVVVAVQTDGNTHTCSVPLFMDPQ